MQTGPVSEGNSKYLPLKSSVSKVDLTAPKPTSAISFMNAVHIANVLQDFTVEKV
jgi:hypothetical protein